MSMLGHRETLRVLCRALGTTGEAMQFKTPDIMGGPRTRPFMRYWGSTEITFQLGKFHFQVVKEYVLVTIVSEEEDRCWLSGLVEFPRIPSHLEGGAA